ncbi:RING finger protein 122-like [Ruditapes philippinarum]|uniref:RING finger protein 122-like n=1 Tax=Ruditapes philippinarum TaxID=129788 RepID=UPI00295BD7C2|nr:RING finger protein 122-like [Ruditapes philippinarum]XP_060570413.1 RING finger protein 122-like [Ruditapes philippinarum]
MDTIPGSVSLPLLGIGVFTLLLSVVFCCYMWKLKRDARQERGYRRIEFSPKKKNLRNDTCPVCLDEFLSKEKIAICTCHHVFHSKCLLEWLRHKNNCPMCKAPVRKDTSASSSRVSPAETTGLILSIPPARLDSVSEE